MIVGGTLECTNRPCYDAGKLSVLPRQLDRRGKIVSNLTDGKMVKGRRKTHHCDVGELADGFAKKSHF